MATISKPWTRYESCYIFVTRYVVCDSYLVPSVRHAALLTVPSVDMEKMPVMLSSMD